jgi:hypothetical protein
MKSVKKLESVKNQVAQLNGKAIVGGEITLVVTYNSLNKLSSGTR